MSVNRTYPVEGIVLRGFPLGEADRILVLFIPGMGLKRVVAKGIRKPKSRIGGRLEPFRENRVLLAKGRSMDLVTQVESLRAFPAIQQDYDSLAAGMSASELLLAFLEEDVPSEEIYEQYVEFLGLLGPGTEAEILLTAYELQLLELLGYRPELHTCLTCDRELTDPKDVRGLNIEAGGTVCVYCEGLMPGRVYRLSPGAWQLLARLQDTPLTECHRFKGVGPILATCRQALKAYMSYRAEKELKAQGMFEWQGIVPTPAPGPAPRGEAELPF